MLPEFSVFDFSDIIVMADDMILHLSILNSSLSR